MNRTESRPQYPLYAGMDTQIDSAFSLETDTTVYVAVASTKPNKIAAAVNALASVLGADIKLEGLGFAAQSGVAEQPYGAEQTQAGCAKRLEHLRAAPLEIPEGSVIYYVALENGLFPQSPAQNPSESAGEELAAEFLDDGLIYVDRCCTLISDAAGHTLASCSAGPLMPARFVNSSRETAWARTAADFLVEEFGDTMPDLKASAWHGSFCPKTREQLMQDALELSLKAYLEQQN